MGQLAGLTAIVTGAGQGIGRAIAEKFAMEGATVVIAEMIAEAAAETAAAVGGIAYPVDVTDLEAVAAMAEWVRDHCGQIDVLVNNAGWDKAGPFVDSDPADWDRVIAVNLYGTLHTCKAILPIMAQQGRGSIINLASDAGRVGSSGEAVYSATKGGVIAFSKTIARENARHGITVNCVCPGPTDTALLSAVTDESPGLRDALVRAIPLRRLAAPSDLAGAVTFLASPEAAYITGQTISVSGGLSMV